MPCRRRTGAAVVLALALAAAGGGGRASAVPVDLPPTFTPSTLRARAGQVIDVSGTNCTLGGHAMESAGVGMNPSGGNSYHGTPSYDVEPDGSWSGFFAIPQLARPGPHSIESYCSADDQFIGGPKYDFEVLAGAPAEVTVSAVGGSVTVAGSKCLDGGKPLPEASVLVEPERSGRYLFHRRPLPEPSARPAVAGDGSFRAEVKLPGPGRWEVFARCWSDSLVLETTAHRVEATGAGSAQSVGAATTGSAPSRPKTAGSTAALKRAIDTPGTQSSAGDEASGSRAGDDQVAARTASRSNPEQGSRSPAPLAAAVLLALTGGAAGVRWRRLHRATP